MLRCAPPRRRFVWLRNKTQASREKRAVDWMPLYSTLRNERKARFDALGRFANRSTNR